MSNAKERTVEFSRAIFEIIQKTRYRCDLSSLNSPDPEWVKVIISAMDIALATNMDRSRPTQFRFLFGQTPMSPTSPPANYIALKNQIIRLVKSRSQHWEVMPEIWLGRFYRLKKGIVAGMQNKILGDGVISNGDTKMTWNHSKIIAVDGVETLVGGHNLNMDLFTSYPPVHDVSIVAHGTAAYGSQLFLNKMWECKTDLISKEYLDSKTQRWKIGDDDNSPIRRPIDILQSEKQKLYMLARLKHLSYVHKNGQINAPQKFGLGPLSVEQKTYIEQEFSNLKQRFPATDFDHISNYKLSSRMLSVGKYWSGPMRDNDYQKASEVMKEKLIKGAKYSIKMSQMDIVSAWKKKWSDHVVCQWLLEALLANPLLTVKIVLSPLDAGAGIGGDQYSFGSGASRTFELMEYYMTHDVSTDTKLNDVDGKRLNALKRLHIAPLYYTDKVPAALTTEGLTYKWPSTGRKIETATLKQPPLSKIPPKKGVIGSAVKSVFKASGVIYKKVTAAPGNHAKIMIIDDECYVVGSDNLYPGYLSEFNYMVEGSDAVNELLKSYWRPLWLYSGHHCVNPNCKLARNYDLQ